MIVSKTIVEGSTPSTHARPVYKDTTRATYIQESVQVGWPYGLDLEYSADWATGVDARQASYLMVVLAPPSGPILQAHGGYGVAAAQKIVGLLARVRIPLFAL